MGCGVDCVYINILSKQGLLRKAENSDAASLDYNKRETLYGHTVAISCWMR